MTRATEHCILLTHYKDSIVSHVNNEKLINSNYIEYIDYKTREEFVLNNTMERYEEVLKEIKENQENQENQNNLEFDSANNTEEEIKFNEYNVTNILDHLSILTREYNHFFSKKKIKWTFEEHNFKTLTRIKFLENTPKEYVENVSGTNGILFPLFFFAKNNIEILRVQLDIFEQELKDLIKEGNDTKMFNDMLNWIEEIRTDDFKSNKSFVKYSIIIQALQKNFVPYYQVRTDDWIPEEDKKYAIRAFESLYTRNLEYEKTTYFSGFLTKKDFDNIEEDNDILENMKNIFTIEGRVDVIDHINKTIWENKYVNKLNKNHYLQAIIYKLMLEKEDPKYVDYKIKIFNLKNQTIEEIILNNNAIDLIKLIVMRKILMNKKSISKAKILSFTSNVKSKWSSD